LLPLTRQAIDFGGGLLGQRAHGHIQPRQNLRHHAVALFEQGEQQVFRLDLAVAVALGGVLRADQRFL